MPEVAPAAVDAHQHVWDPARAEDPWMTPALDRRRRPFDHAEVFRPHRLMYGGDWPFALLAADSYTQIWVGIRDCLDGLDPEALWAVLGGTARFKPCRATIKASDQRERWSVRCLGLSKGCVPDGERFLCLPFLFMDPLGATRASSERHREVARLRLLGKNRLTATAGQRPRIAIPTASVRRDHAEDLGRPPARVEGLIRKKGDEVAGLAACRSKVEDDLAVTAHMPLTANDGKGSLRLETHRGEDLAGVGERILNLPAEPLVVAGLVATLTKVEPLLQAADELLPTRMTDGEPFHSASRPLTSWVRLQGSACVARVLVDIHRDGIEAGRPIVRSAA
jgi:hypothetical protein